MSLTFWPSACDVPPEVKNGTWNCKATEHGKSCKLDCETGFHLLGLADINCTSYDGWQNMQNWLEVPLCLGNVLRNSYITPFI